MHIILTPESLTMRSMLLRRLNNMRLKRLGGRVFISGTGRAGTTFLIQLLTDLGLDTGFDRADAGGSLPSSKPETLQGEYFDTARAGFERDIFRLDNPLIVKSPFLCDHVDDLLTAGIRISHLVIPVRDIRQAAESRRFVQKATTGQSDGASVAGGLWDTDQSSKQEEILAMKLARLIEAGARNSIPMTFLSYPRLVRDADYTYEALRFLFPSISRTTFRKHFDHRSNPDLVHDFSVG
jgi:hypothetical protein